MKISRENRIMHGLLILCIVAGFACFALIVLPDQLAKAGIVARAPKSDGPSNISGVVSLAKDAPAKRLARPSGTVARFVPEGRPADPYAAEAREIEPPLDEDYEYEAVGGAGAAMDDDSYESRQHLEMDDGGDLHARAVDKRYESDLAIGDPYGDTGYEERKSGYLAPEPEPEKVKHTTSSLSRGDPATIDSERGKRKKPWLLPPPGFEKDVAFWRDIYAKYDRNYSVLHHPRHLDIIYDVVNMTDIENDPRLTDIERAHMRKKRIDAQRERIEDALRVLATNPPATKLTHEQWRINKLFVNVNERNKFKRACDDDGVRAQLGQRDKFIAGLTTSGQHLGEIEAIFESYGMPKELTRIIFVESMFNTKAISSAGASGIWQFMPRTGRLYLNITKIADERNDPLKSTHAAARLLRQNYEELGTWPLAINAYNAGRGRLKQAVQQTGTRDIGTIMRNFNHRAYGFASRNFYLEFIAAYEVAEHAERYFGRIDHDEPLEYEIVRSNYHISLPDVARLSGISMEEMKDLNPAFTNHIMAGKNLVPRHTKLRVPTNRGDVFLASAARAPKSRTGTLYHVVNRGETLSAIAAAYGVTPAAIMKKNKVGRTLRNGQKLAIPAGSDI